MQTPFSLARLKSEVPGLARQFLWNTNPSLNDMNPTWLHLGCGARVFDGFTNLDIAPQHVSVVAWNLHDIWPEDLDRVSEGAFSEDCIEHFFHAEQTYILCNLNRSLQQGATARILMPSLERLVAMAKNPLDPNDYLRITYGVETAADAVNYAMRFTAHRWLHDNTSLARMAEICGFEATPTSCAKSTVPFLSNRNLRSEGLPFANDLRKSHHVNSMAVLP